MEMNTKATVHTIVRSAQRAMADSRRVSFSATLNLVSSIRSLMYCITVADRLLIVLAVSSVFVI